MSRRPAQGAGEPAIGSEHDQCHGHEHPAEQEQLRLGWRQEDLAERLKIDRTTISAWEAERSNIGLDWLEPLCSTLSVDLADLFRDLEPARLQVLGVRDVRQR